MNSGDDKCRLLSSFFCHLSTACQGEDSSRDWRHAASPDCLPHVYLVALYSSRNPSLLYLRCKLLHQFTLYFISLYVTFKKTQPVLTLGINSIALFSFYFIINHKTCSSPLTFIKEYSSSLVVLFSLSLIQTCFS